MTPQEARELFSAAYDSELDEKTRQAFDQALAGDAVLATEYAEFRALLKAAAADGGGPDSGTPDLLPGVQRRLRARSRGRFYRDRFAERAGLGAKSPLIVAAVMLMVAGMVWIAWQVVQTIAV